jgi:hypothetical protein
MVGCMMWATAEPQSTMIRSRVFFAFDARLGKPASLSRTLAANALVWRLEVPDAMIALEQGR